MIRSFLCSEAFLYRNTHRTNFDVAIIGGGIVGLATAYRLSQLMHPPKIVLLEKELEVGKHQSSHNSGVIHAGIYYQPGSDRARLCVQGLQLMYSFLKEHNLPFKKCGKLIVATQKSELPLLHDLYTRALQNKCPGIQKINSQEEITLIEPHCRGIAAIHSPETGITDFHKVCKKLQELLTQQNVEIRTKYQADCFHQSDNRISIVNRNNPNERITAKYMISCCGSESDRVAEQCGLSRSPAVVPIRGKWSVIKPEYGYLVKGNIYPVPNPKLPFLGVHFSKKVHTEAIWSGPNSIVALSREGYNFWDINVKDCVEMMSYSGFYKLLANHWKSGALELYHDLLFDVQLKRMQKYIPELSKDHFEEKSESGVRAAVVTSSGDIVHDFMFTTNSNRNQLHVRNAPSPAATSCFAIADEICARAKNELNGFSC